MFLYAKTSIFNFPMHQVSYIKICLDNLNNPIFLFFPTIKRTEVTECRFRVYADLFGDLVCRLLELNVHPAPGGAGQAVKVPASQA
jgi:hypothetical protein